MYSAVPIVHTDATVTSVEDMLITAAADFATINYIYVVDEQHVLIGVFSIRELFRSEKAARVADFMHTTLVSVSPEVDQEEVVRQAIRHSIKCVPVLTSAGVLLGVVTMDTILDIIHHETTEDFLRLSGTTTDGEAPLQLITASAGTHIIKRLPWLVVGLFGGILAAAVVSGFEAVLLEYVVIAAFIPLIVYLADAVGSQIQLIFIRSLALRPHLSVWSYFFREVRINLVVGVVLALAIAAISFVWFADIRLSIILTISVLATVCAAMCIAVALPWFFHKTHRDPAIASGPFATVVIDVISLLIYFSVASLLLV